MPIASLHQSRPLHGLDEFFEGGQALPPFDPATKKVYGRAWSADELRLKSFEELHKLWFVLLKELNLLATQEAEAKRMGQRWFGPHRIHKVSLCKLVAYF
jgi:large subunit ribosomal protein L47